MLGMLFRRMGCSKRVLALALLVLVLVYFLHWKLSFESDAYHPDPQLGQYIRSRFPLMLRPEASPASVRIVHFMHKTHKILPDHRRFLSSWRRVYPSYDLYFWTDADIDRLLTVRYPELKSFYDNRLSNPLERSDFARVLILHAFGGWYADLDAGCQLNAENVTEQHSLVVPLEPFMHALIPFNRRRLVNNAIMYSRPGHPYWMFLVGRIADCISMLPDTPRRNIDAVYTTGPLTMTMAMEQFAAAYASTCGGIYEGLGRSFGCPYVPGPRRFLPLIDNSSSWMAGWAKIMCHSVLWEPGMLAECQRLRTTNFANALPPDAYTYHAFMHLTGVKGAETNISSWGLDIRLKPMDYLS